MYEISGEDFDKLTLATEELSSIIYLFGLLNEDDCSTEERDKHLLRDVECARYYLWLHLKEIHFKYKDILLSD